MITVGLDFGTHQTKVCIEDKEGSELSYRFLRFPDAEGNLRFTLPSAIHFLADGRLHYGYPTKDTPAETVRYFKQVLFNSGVPESMPKESAKFYAIWYLAYIIFLLEEKYGKDFAIQMGAPMGETTMDFARHTAVETLVSAYQLVEDVFENNLQKFLDTPAKQLLSLTPEVEYSDDIKNEYGILVFPEAYACLKPLTSRGRIGSGMSLMVDIGGGTTDISFFTIQNGAPAVYKFWSLNKGLNYLTDSPAASS